MGAGGYWFARERGELHSFFHAASDQDGSRAVFLRVDLFVCLCLCACVYGRRRATREGLPSCHSRSEAAILVCWLRLGEVLGGQASQRLPPVHAHLQCAMVLKMFVVIVSFLWVVATLLCNRAPLYSLLFCPSRRGQSPFQEGSL